MINIMKWELLKWYYRLRWIILSTFGVFAFFIILTLLGSFNSINSFNKYVLEGISLLLLLSTLGLCILLPSANMIIDYILPHKYMEQMVQRNNRIVIFVKLIVNCVLFHIGVIIQVLMAIVFKKFISNGEEYFSVTGGIGADIVLFMLFGFMIPMLLLFFYMITYYIKAPIKNRIMITFIIMLFTFLGIYFLEKIPIVGKTVGGFVLVIGIIIVSEKIFIIDKKYEPK